MNAHMFFIFLFQEEYKDDVILALTSSGIEESVMMEGKNVSKVLSGDVPLFSGFFMDKRMGSDSAYIYTGSFNDMEQMEEALDTLRDSVDDEDLEDILRVIVLPVENIVVK